MVLRVETCEAPLTPRNADHTGPSRRYVLITGNECTVTASMKETGDGICNFTVNYAWVSPPSTAEKGAMEGIIRDFLRTEPDATGSSADEAGSAKWQEEFLGGKR